MSDYKFLLDFLLEKDDIVNRRVNPTTRLACSLPSVGKSAWTIGVIGAVFFLPINYPNNPSQIESVSNNSRTIRYRHVHIYDKFPSKINLQPAILYSLLNPHDKYLAAHSMANALLIDWLNIG